MDITEIARKIEQAEDAGASAYFEHTEKTKSNISTEDRANVLIQALPYIQKWSGKTIVVKYGGNAMLSGGLKEAVLGDILVL